MRKQEKATAIIGLIVIIAICLMLIAVAAVFINKNGGFGSLGFKEKEEPETAAFSYMNELKAYAVFTDGSRLYIEDVPETQDAQQIYKTFLGKMSAEFTDVQKDKKSAKLAVSITCPDLAAYEMMLKSNVESYLSSIAANATSRDELYNSDMTYREDVLNEAYHKALYAVNADTELPDMTVGSSLVMRYSRGWVVENTAIVDRSLDNMAVQIKNSVLSDLTVFPVTYKIEETATQGTPTDPAGWGETDDPSVVAALLQTDTAKRLIGDEKLVWNPDIERIPGTPIRYYLDESILMIQWHETEAKTFGTLAEVFIADGSQFRRKIAGDSFGDMNFETTTDYAKDTNAVLALGGDFYNHGRNCGICVYNRSIYRFDNTSCDDCYITPDGDMLFSYRGQFSTIDEAQTFVDENDILFSICFGPVLIENGTDVTPDVYPWGEIDDTYARSALGMLGRHHYLTLNMNCKMSHHWYLATLRDAANAMIKRGCIKAYTLDGGQTATTAVNGVLVNPVQFEKQRLISDIIYFCSAVPRE